MVSKVLALHDMVCLGRCSLTVVIPALSAQGMKVCPLPTALLSSDTGGFGPVYVRELTAEMEGILAKLQALEERFDAVYSGYLGSPAQAALVRRTMELFPGLRVVDPVLGDQGRLYQSVDEGMVQAMEQLCSQADVITPNLTEACFLTGTPMPQGPMDPLQAHRLLQDLLRLGCRAAVVTSAHLQGREGRLATLVQGEDGEAVALCTQQLHAHFPGTGDLFASVLVGALLKGKDLQEAAAEASAFVARSIAYTLERGTPVREGVLLEELLGELAGVLSGAGMERLPL